MKYSAGILLCLLPIHTLSATDEMSCSLSVLSDLGWRLADNRTDIGFEKTDTCNTIAKPLFKYNSTTENTDKILIRSQQTLKSITSKCLFNRRYHKSVKGVINNLTENRDFKFLPVGDDPRDPFSPPEGTWNTSSGKGYDIPLQSITHSIRSLYNKPFVAECSTAVQIAQLASLTEHYADQTDKMIDASEVGIGTWNQYAKTPSIAAKQSLFISRRDRHEDGLSKLAATGRSAFYGQIGYIKPYKGTSFIDSWDNRGQNYMVVDITDKAVAAIKARNKPLKELSRLSRDIWKKYRKRRGRGEPIEKLKEEMQLELEAADPFFNDIEIYVHPLRTKNFAAHLARQFGYNPRTPYVFEVYEDFQPGYFYKRFIDHRMKQCMQ